MKFIKGKRPQNGQSGRTKAFQALRQGGTRNRLRVAAANKASKVKRLRAIQKHSTNGKLNNKNMMSKNNARVAMNVVDARVKLLQKALEKPTVIVDARQKLTKQKDAREKIQERRLHSTPYDTMQYVETSRGHSNNLGRVKIDRRGILTVKSILDERATSHHSEFRDRRPDRQSSVNQGRFDGVEKRRSSNTFNSELNTFRSDRPIEEIRPVRRDMRMSRRPIQNTQSMRRPPERPTRPMRVNDKPYNRPMAMDYEDSMEWEDTNRYSPTPVMRRNVGNTMFNHDGYQDDLSDRNSRNHRGLSETLRSRLDSHQTALAKRARPPIGHKIIISNLEPSVTCEDIRELFADIGDLLESKVIRPGVAEVIYNRRADAIQAVDVYHNRQLDGRPMKCDMVRNAGSNSGPISVSGSLFKRKREH
ncbi:uncharacterized protein LOC132940757 isoform X2 [Metopolophium dirhodum]|uniref:uncharacterized protein LOC132940757 isoform X2 n=1 Tax=Metopolophium dirhodum TaxID=44670 RepID=UPI00298FCEB1|nr:uncharacterized protein LOC132940757 isoform X2 [Metopolophium dirhodum]